VDLLDQDSTSEAKCKLPRQLYGKKVQKVQKVQKSPRGTSGQAQSVPWSSTMYRPDRGAAGSQIFIMRV
jgi:hypothetical protein